MMQHRRQQRQSSTFLRTNLCRQLSTIGARPSTQHRLCRSTTTSFLTSITTLVSPSTTTSSPSSSSLSSSTPTPSSSYSSCAALSINRRSIRSNSNIIGIARSNTGAYFTCSSVLLSILAWSVTLLLILSCFGVADAGVLMGHPLGKRSYIDLGCKGVYDKSIFARLDRVCEDCYNLFREPTLHTLCRKDCFTTYYFKGCVESLLMQDEMEQFKRGIKQLHGADPGV